MARRNEYAAIHLEAIRHIVLTRIDMNQAIAAELFVRRQSFSDDQSFVAQISEAALQMKQRGGPRSLRVSSRFDVDQAARTAVLGQNLNQLLRTFFVRALGNADKEMRPSFTNIAAINCAETNFAQRRKQTREFTSHT